MFQPLLQSHPMDRLPDSDAKVIFSDKWHRRASPASPEILPTVTNSEADHTSFALNVTISAEINVTPTPDPSSQLPAQPAAPPLVPERSDFLNGDAPAADRVESFLTHALGASDGSDKVTAALVPWICDALLSNHSIKASELLIWGGSRLTDSGVICLRRRCLDNSGCDGF